MDENVLVKNLLPCVKKAGSKIIDIYNSKPNAEQKNDGSDLDDGECDSAGIDVGVREGGLCSCERSYVFAGGG